ncbi:hypothetical protein BGX28_005904 [Mortierella sp. GBA30]|nr:hypothetical protein BGX28_005904 [Mortierella sp. GBA30]
MKDTRYYIATVVSLEYYLNESKVKKDHPSQSGQGKKSSASHDLLMNEILAMGGSEQDLELLNDIDSGSEIECGDESDSDDDQKQTKSKTAVQSSKATGKKTFGKNKPGTSEQDVEPGLKNEVASFMKSLFGTALMDSNKMGQAAEEEEDEEEMEEANRSDDDNQSEGSWETEEEENGINDSGDDSMDDLPQELKDITAQLDKKRKADVALPAPSSSKPTKKSKKERESAVAIPASITSAKKNDIKNVQKQVSAILSQPGKKTKQTKGAVAAQVPKAKKAAIKTPTTSSSKKSIKAKKGTKKPTWKLGDGWSKALEDD